jgi:hypothetical protein
LVASSNAALEHSLIHANVNPKSELLCQGNPRSDVLGDQLLRMNS